MNKLKKIINSPVMEKIDDIFDKTFGLLCCVGFCLYLLANAVGIIWLLFNI